MILSNNVPNAIWDSAMGPMGVRFPPSSWSRGGGGYMGYDQYGLAKSITDEVMADVLGALSRAVANVKAQILISNVTPVDRGALLASLGQTQMNIDVLSGDSRAAVISGHQTLDQWLDQAEIPVAQLKRHADQLGDAELSGWLDGVISGARGVQGFNWKPWAVGLGLVAAAFIGYKTLKK